MAKIAQNRKISRKKFRSFLIITFFLGVAAQIRLDFANRKFNCASFSSRDFFPGPILKELEGGYFRKSAVFSLFLKLQGAISSSKIDLEAWFLYQNVGNFPLKMFKSSFVSYFPKWKRENWKTTFFLKSVDFGVKIGIFSFFKKSPKITKCFNRGKLCAKWKLISCSLCLQVA